MYTSLHGKNEFWGCFQRWQHRRKIERDKNRSSSATTIECGAQCANYSATHRVNQRKKLKHRDVDKDAQSTAKHNAIWRSFVLSYISFKCFPSFLVACWIEVEWEDRGGPELVRDLEALGLEDGRDVLPVEAGIAWYCDTSRNNHKQVWYRFIMHFKNIQVYLSYYCNIWYNIGPKSNPYSRLMQTPD